MAVHSSYKGYSQAMLAKAKRIEDAMRAANAEIDREMKKAAHQAMSGTISTQTLRRLGHPFGRGRRRATAKVKRAGRTVGRVRGSVRGKAPLLPINAQTGKLRRSLRASVHGGEHRLTVNTRYAKFVLGKGGTTKMVDRGFDAYMKKRLKWEMARAKGQIIKAMHS